jgi:hypothetical protein
MSAGKNPDPGYRLPDVVDPEDSVCIRAYVPNADEYIAAFWQSYEFLTKWLAWERDDGHSGALAAAAWLPRFLRAREEWLCSGGECGLMDVRQKPDEPCVLQKQLCCDGEWIDFATISLCTVGPEPYQDDPIDELLDILWSWKTVIEQIDDYLDDGKSASEIKVLMSSLISYLPGLTSVIDDMASTSEEDRQDAIDDFPWEDALSVFWCTGGECGIQSSGWLDDMGDWLDCLIDTVLDWTDEQTDKMSEWVSGTLDGIADTTGIIAVANLFPDGGTNFGYSEPTCYFDHTFNFASADGGWSVWQTGWDSGEWVSSSGWEARHHDDDDIYCRKQHNIHIEFDAQHIDTFRVDMSYVKGYVDDVTGASFIIRACLGGGIKT